MYNESPPFYETTKIMEKVLIVDDEENILKALSVILKEEGFSVLTEKNGKKGLETFLKEKPNFIFLDVWLPEMDGLELLENIKREKPDAIVIMISGHGTISTAMESVKKGAFDFIEKPLSLERVLNSLKNGIEYRKLLLERKELLPIMVPPKKESLKQKEEKRQEEVKSSLKLKDKILKQKTIKKSTVLYGVGLHSGLKTGLILNPAPPNTGIRLLTIPQNIEIPARLENVVKSGYATCLGKDGVLISTVEHFLASCHCFGITNLIVKVHSEIPVMDGSALEFCKVFEEAGIEEQEEGIEPIIIKKTYSVVKGKEKISIKPYDGLKITYHLDYPPPVGKESFTYEHKNPEKFIEEIAPARTFGFMKDIGELEKMGLGSGGRLNNFILIGEEGVLNTTLRFEKEFSRHKILDIFGDIYLLGRPIFGEIEAFMTGHSDNHNLLREIIKDAL
ncbi:MAG: UDP-3-O-acyl-N-acetylglucosamine deacetylase [Thermoanaerobaculia bacterium]